VDGTVEAAAAAAALRAQPHDAAVQQAGCRVLHLLATRSEVDAMAVVVADGVALCAAALRTHAASAPDVAREACLALRDAVCYDARRCFAACADGADGAAFLALDAHAPRLDVQLPALSLLAALLNTDDSAVARATAPGALPARMEAVLRALSRHAPACPRLTSCACAVLAALGTSDAAGPLACARGAFATLVAAAQAHAASADVQHTVMCAFGQLCTGRAQEEEAAMIAAGAVQLCVAMMRTHARCNEPDVVGKACGLLNRMCEAAPVRVCDALLSVGGGAAVAAETLRLAQAPGAPPPPPDHDSVGSRSFWAAQLLCELARHAPTKLAARVPDAPRLLLGALLAEREHIGLAACACVAAGRLALLAAPPGLSADDVAAGVDIALFTMRTHADDPQAQQSACWALHVMCERSACVGACPAAVAHAAAGGAAALLARVDATLRAAGQRQEPLCAEALTTLLRLFPAGGGAAVAAAAAAAPARMPASFLLRHTCDACGSAPTERLKRCGSCRAARYCSAACQRAHWAEHKATCRPSAAAPAGDATSGISGASAAAAAADGA
jgi:hypothetical protein